MKDYCKFKSSSCPRSTVNEASGPGLENDSELLQNIDQNRLDWIGPPDAVYKKFGLEEQIEEKI